MGFESQLELLEAAYTEFSRHQWHTARGLALPVIQAMNQEVCNATRRARLPGLKYQRHYLSHRDYLRVLRPQGFADTSVDSVTTISWNKYFNDVNDSHTLVGSLIRHGKQYRFDDKPIDPRAVRALAFLTSIVANKMSQPGDQRIVVSAPSSMSSSNTLPRQLAELCAANSRRYQLSHSDALVRCRDIGQMKNIINPEDKFRLVRGSMVAETELFRGRQVLLIDDLLGAGGTLRESARALKVAGALEVHALVMAKTRSYAKRTMFEP